MNAAGVRNRRSARRGWLVLASALLALTLAAIASAAPGDVAYRGCIGADTTVTGCAATSDATSGGTGSGMDIPQSSAVSPDGKNVYVASFGGDAVNQFARDPATGELSYQGCITSNSSLAACTKIPGAAAGGTNTGLDGLRSVAISPDGLSLYTTSSASDAIARFTRDPASSNGALTYRDCITTNSSVMGCTVLLGAAAMGTNTALDNPQGVAVSPDGISVYMASTGGDALSRFTRNPGTGALSFEDCITSDTAVAACGKIPDAAAAGTDTPLDQVRGVSVTPDGSSVFTASAGGDAVSRFGRDPTTGGISFQGCITSNSSVDPCSAIPGATSDGTGTGLDVLNVVVPSPDGTSLYTGGNESIAHFSRDPATGVVTYVGCITSASNVSGCVLTPNAAAEPNFQGITDLRSVTVSADGENVYSASGVGSTVATFDRGPAGQITLRTCLTGDSDVNFCTQVPGAAVNGDDNGLDSMRSISLDPDDKTIYVVSQASDSIGTLDRELTPVAPPANEFSIGKLKRNKRKGTAKLAVEVPGPGSIALAGKTLKPKTVTADGAGTVRLAIKAKGKSRKKLKKRGKAKVKAAITFTPTGGSANTIKKKLKLVRRR